MDVSKQKYKGETLLFWAVQWFQLSNDEFYMRYGFNFNPHAYPGLYEKARKIAYPKPTIQPDFRKQFNIR